MNFFRIRNFYEVIVLPYNDDDAVKDVVRVSDVSKKPKSQQHEAHLQNKHAGENDVTNLQHIS